MYHLFFAYVDFCSDIKWVQYRTGKNLTKCVCSEYEGQELLDMWAPTLCPDYFPPEQDCTLPLNPGEYGSLVGGPLDITLPEISDFIGKTHGIFN